MSQTVARTKRRKKKSHISISLTFVSLQNRVSFLWSVTSRTCFSMRCHVEVHLDNTRAQRRPQRCAAGPESAIEKRQINRYEFDLHPRVRFPPSLHSFRGVVASCCFKKVSSGAALHIRSPPWHACTTYVLEYCGECCVYVWFTHPTMCGIKILLTDFKYGCCLTPRGKLVQTKYAFTENTEYLFNKVLYSRRVLMC